MRRPVAALVALLALSGCGAPTRAPGSTPPGSAPQVAAQPGAVVSAGPSGSPGSHPPSPSASRPATPAHTVAPARPAAPALSGVGAADRNAWAAWLGRPVQINETWNDAKDAAGDVTWDKMDGLYSTWANFGNGKWPGALSIGQPMFAANETVATCATTAEITNWARLLLKAWPRGDAWIRLGWEFNGNWYHWGVKAGQETAFKNCWIRWHDRVKAVSPKFRLVWNPNSQSSDAKLDVRKFWPGAQYVDAAGPDEYALSWGGSLMSPHQLGPNGEPLGIAAWASWVAARGVPLAVPEWGIHDGVTWGSVDPAYIRQMRDAFVAAAGSPSGLAYETYFDGGTGYACAFSLHDPGCAGKHTADADLYRSLWRSPYR